MKAPFFATGKGLTDILGLMMGLIALGLYPLLPFAASPVATQLFLVGMVLVLGAFAGHIAERMHLPRITGCIFIGCLVSPSLVQLFPAWHLPTLIKTEQAQSLKLINELAIGMIALMAGAEIRTVWLRERLKTILSITTLEILVVPAAIAAVILCAPIIPGLAEIPFVRDGVASGVPAWAIAALAGTIIVANGPTVVVSVLKETGGRGPLSHTVMGVSVIMDTIVIVIFTMMVALITVIGEQGAAAVIGTEGNVVLAKAGGVVIGSIVLSVVVGLSIGIGLKYYTEHSDHRLSWTLVGLALGVAAFGPLIGIKPLFCLLAAGFACENLTSQRSELGAMRLEKALKRVANPVFVLFFVAAGINLDLVALADYWILVLLLSGVRLVCVWSCVRLGGNLSGAEPVVTKYAWVGMVSQAGVTLALAQLTASRFPGWGEILATIIVAMVALHELIGPAAFAWTIRRAGEAASEKEVKNGIERNMRRLTNLN
jgi:Kef-type K+ transport system membrane component KefB